MLNIKISIAFLLICAFSQLFSQNDITVKRQMLSVPKSSTIQMTKLSDDYYQNMKNTVIHEPGMEKLQLKSWKKEVMENPKLQVPDIHRKTMVAPPVVGANFTGNFFDGGIPSDNDISISNAGQIVAVQNTSIGVYDTTGTQLSLKSLSSFASSLGLSGTKFDPKTIYDPIHDRFIIVYLNGSSPNNSKVIVAFSASNSATGSWHLYSLDGNVTGNVWTDFPSIGITDSELFITGNLFLNSTSQGGVVWQISLTEGYNGAQLNPAVHSNNYFSLCPVRGGSGPISKMYFLRTESVLNSDNVYVHEMTGTIANNGVLATPVQFSMGLNYIVPVNAPQKGTTNTLTTNDCRIQSAYLENEVINFVMNTSAGSPARASIFLGSIILNPLGLNFATPMGQYITYPGTSIAFPSVVYSGCGSPYLGNNSTIFVDFSSSTQNPGIACLSVDSIGDFSPLVQIKEGTGYIGNSNDFRWGDYTGVAKRYNHPGEIWAYGTIGTSSHINANWIGQILVADCANLTSVSLEKSINQIHVFPNPAPEMVQVNFDVMEDGEYQVCLYDLQGKKMELLSDYLRKGKAQFRMRTEKLAHGNYILVITKNGTNIHSQQIVKN